MSLGAPAAAKEAVSSGAGAATAAVTESPSRRTVTPSTATNWHPQQEKLLKQWGETASSNRWMHHTAHLKYARMHMGFTLPVIILSSLTGTMNFAQSSFPPSYRTLVPIGIGIINIFTGIISTISSFLRVSELSEGNRVAALSYGKLASNIRVELLLPRTERTMSGSDFIAICRAELDRLTEQTPDIPVEIERKFNREFSTLIIQGDDAFYTPNILTMRAVDIYKPAITTTTSTNTSSSTEETSLDMPPLQLQIEPSSSRASWHSSTSQPRRPSSAAAAATVAASTTRTKTHGRPSTVFAAMKKNNNNNDNDLTADASSSAATVASIRRELDELKSRGHVSTMRRKSETGMAAADEDHFFVAAEVPTPAHAHAAATVAEPAGETNGVVASADAIVVVIEGNAVVT